MRSQGWDCEGKIQTQRSNCYAESLMSLRFFLKAQVKAGVYRSYTLVWVGRLATSSLAVSLQLQAVVCIVGGLTELFIFVGCCKCWSTRGNYVSKMKSISGF